MVEPVSVTTDSFEKEVVNADKPVIIDLWAPWCMPCQMMAPVFKEVSEELTNYKFVKINIDEENLIAKDLLVTGIPLIVIYEDGEEIGRFVGYKDKQALINEIKEIIMKNQVAD
ncbi:thioredoxin [archaeon]|nr:thioredoxin [archaeon]